MLGCVYTRVRVVYKSKVPISDTLQVLVSMTSRAECSKICVRHLRAKIKLRNCTDETRPRPDTNIHLKSSRFAARGASTQD